MTLKEKFLPFIDDIDLINDIPNKEWGLRNADKCVEVAEEFAIGFKDWCDNEGRFIIGTSTTKELLEIYKKEKGL
jgi:hypothetical protein